PERDDGRHRRPDPGFARRLGLQDPDPRGHPPDRRAVLQHVEADDQAGADDLPHPLRRLHRDGARGDHAAREVPAQDHGPARHRGRERPLARAHPQIGRIATVNTRVFALASALLGAALWGCASSPEAGIAESQQMLDDGREAARHNRHVEAIVLFTSAVKVNPDLAEGWFERGKSHIHLRLDPKADGESRGFEQKALEDFSMAVRKNPAYADAYFNRAMILSSRAQYKAAVDDLMNA